MPCPCPSICLGKLLLPCLGCQTDTHACWHVHTHTRNRLSHVAMQLSPPRGLKLYHPAPPLLPTSPFFISFFPSSFVMYASIRKMCSMSRLRFEPLPFVHLSAAYRWIWALILGLLLKPMLPHSLLNLYYPSRYPSPPAPSRSRQCYSRETCMHRDHL